MEIYTDGACAKNPGPGGLGVVVMEEGKIIHEYCQGFQQTTNNRMEYRAVLYALNYVQNHNFKNVTLYTDSQYVLKSITQWGKKWEQLGWKRKGSQKIENLDLFLLGYRLNQELNIVWKWVKGHQGNRGNQRADFLANQAIRKTEKIEDLIEPLPQEFGNTIMNF